MNQLVYVVDFGGQYCRLISRIIRENHVYCEIIPSENLLERIDKKRPHAIIFSGGPESVTEYGHQSVAADVFNQGIPVLGICYGMQLIASVLGGEVTPAPKGEYGAVEIECNESPLFREIPEKFTCYMNHNDSVSERPEGFRIAASTKLCPVAAMEDRERRIYCVQFHPEVKHTEYGEKIITNFLFEIAKLDGDFTSDSFIEDKINEIRETVKDKKALCALSGGVDSSVAALIMYKAIGKNLTCIFVDHGLLRKGESEMVEKVFKETFDIPLIKIDASQRFLDKLKGVTDPEQKRKIIGTEFIRAFEEESDKLKDIEFLVQGTIYPDVIESGSGKSATIKSHHNVGGLPKNIKFKIIEPLRELFKDEVRATGLKLGIPEKMIFRHPFPGPGLGIRILGEVTKEKCDILREADAIYREELEKADLMNKIWQAFAVLTGVKTVGVMGDERTYSYAVALRAVTSTDGMTAKVYPIPHDVLFKTANRIVNEVKGVNRVVYDITSKPPATIEWE